MSKKNKENNNNLSDVAIGRTLDLLRQKGEQYDVPIVAVKPIEQSAKFKSMDVAKKILDTAKEQNENK